MKIQVLRGNDILEIEGKDTKAGDIINILGKQRICTGDSIYDDDFDCYYIQCGIHLYEECMLSAMFEE